jgi:hypothetical protein
LADPHYPEAELIRAVLDNLSAHTAGAPGGLRRAKCIEQLLEAPRREPWTRISHFHVHARASIAGAEKYLA